MIIPGLLVGVIMDPSLNNELVGMAAAYHVYVGTTPGCKVELQLLAVKVKVFVVMPTTSPTKQIVFVTLALMVGTDTQVNG